MENEMEKFKELDEAFQKIRTSTGNSDVQEMVHKFLTREQTYAQLLKAVSENEKKLDNLRVENDKKSDELHALHIDHDNQDGGVSKNSEENIQILTHEAEIVQLNKDLELIMNRKKNIHLVYDQVEGWSKKTLTKLGMFLDRDDLLHKAKNEPSLGETF